MLNRDCIFKPDGQYTMTDEEFEEIWERFQKTGDTGITPMSKIREKCKENPDIILSYQGDIPFDEYCRRLLNGEYDE